ncbi:hypothetical protein C3L33_15157, partial [Rhododendron williamsianum]
MAMLLLHDSYVKFVSASLIDYILISSEITSEGRRITKLDQILLNGNNIAIVSISHRLFYMPPLIVFQKALIEAISCLLQLVPGGSPDPE